MNTFENPTPYTRNGLILDEKRCGHRFGRFSASRFAHSSSMNRLGAPYAQYLLDDLISGRRTSKTLRRREFTMLTAETKHYWKKNG